uniref:Alcohol dehydrogenase n=1 Tax=uncultured bacterium fosmid pJB148G3 TaxID=1478052 RepID=A0A0H3UAW6_9BACT|nr:hypothetical protein [uncultured bacterium fosmid pJB148G3]
MPKISAGQVLVRTYYTAISSGTERANLVGDPNCDGSKKNVPVTFPRRVGYSGSGEVVAVGEGVTSVQVGDRVVTQWGSHTLYQAFPENRVIRIDDANVRMEEACFLHISTFSLSAIRKVAPELGESCLIVGGGLLGQFAMQFAALHGALPVMMADYSAERRELALKTGADIAIDPAQGALEEQVKAYTNGKGANCVIEVTGNPAALNSAIMATAPMGRVALLGCTRIPVTVDFYHDVHYPGISLIGAHTNTRPMLESRPGSWTHGDDCRAALKYLSAGRLHIHDMIHEIHAPQEAEEVFARLAFDKNFPLGVVFDWRNL